MATPWEDFFSSTAQKVVSGAIDYDVARKAQDNGFTVEGNMFADKSGANVKQPMNQSGLPNGKPIRIFTKADGKLNVPAVAVGLVVGAVLLKRFA